MQGIILAAGMGKRLKKLTANNTKCMVKVNGVALIDRMLHQLQNAKLSRVVIVIGYEGQKLKDYIATLGLNIPIVYVENPSTIQPIIFIRCGWRAITWSKRTLCCLNPILFLKTASSAN